MVARTPGHKAYPAPRSTTSVGAVVFITPVLRSGIIGAGKGNTENVNWEKGDIAVLAGG